MPAFSNISASPNTRRNLKNAQQKALHSATSAPGNDSDDAQHQEVPAPTRPSRKAKQDTIERQRQAQALNDERRGKKTNARKRAGTESYVEAEATSAKYQKTSEKNRDTSLHNTSQNQLKSSKMMPKTLPPPPITRSPYETPVRAHNTGKSRQVIDSDSSDTDDEPLANSSGHELDGEESADEGSITAEAAGFSDDEDDVLPCAQGHKRTFSSASGASAPSSDYDFDLNLNSDDDAIMEAEDATVNKQFVSKHIPNRRDMAFGKEVPMITETTLTRTAAKGNALWPAHAQYKSPTSGNDKNPLINDQHELVQQVIRAGYLDMHKRLLTVHPFPEFKERMQWVRASLLQGADNVLEADPRVSDIISRIKTDIIFVQKLTPLFTDRLSAIRSNIVKAAKAIIPAYKLGTGKECKDKLAHLIDSDRFVFPTTHPDGWEISGGSYLYDIDGRQPYHNLAILTTLKKGFWGSPSAIGFELQDTFESTEDGKKTMMPMIFVAFAATAVFAGLGEWKTGDFRRLNFSAEVFAEVYNAHLEELKEMKEMHPGLMEATLASLFDHCSTSSLTRTNGANLLVDLPQ